MKTSDDILVKKILVTCKEPKSLDKLYTILRPQTGICKQTLVSWLEAMDTTDYVYIEYVGQRIKTIETTQTGIESLSH